MNEAITTWDLVIIVGSAAIGMAIWQGIKAAFRKHRKGRSR